MRDGRSVHDRLRREVLEDARDGVIVAHVLNRQLDAGFAQEVESLREDPGVEVPIAGVVVRRGDREQVVDLQAVDHAHFCAEL